MICFDGLDPSKRYVVGNTDGTWLAYVARVTVTGDHPVATGYTLSPAALADRVVELLRGLDEGGGDELE